MTSRSAAGERDLPVGAQWRHQCDGVWYTVSIEVFRNFSERVRRQPTKDQEAACYKRMRTGERHQEVNRL